MNRNLHRVTLIRKADDMILYYPDLKAENNRVNLHIHDVKRTGWAYYDQGKYPYNLGDMLAIPICEFMLSRR